jgi:hypothetical protein
LLISTSSARKQHTLVRPKTNNNKIKLLPRLGSRAFYLLSSFFHPLLERNSIAF